MREGERRERERENVIKYLIFYLLSSLSPSPSEREGGERERENNFIFYLLSSLSLSPSLPLPPSVKLALLSRVKEVRAGAMRVLRYTLSSSHVYETMLHFKIDHLVARSLDSPPQRDIERLQAMRFVRQVSQYNFVHFQ